MVVSKTTRIGVDIGGTKVAAGLVDATGTILFQTRVPMPAREDAAAGFAAVEKAINTVFNAQLQARASLAGIGICAPGPLDPFRGVVLNPPNLPCWRGWCFRSGPASCSRASDGKLLRHSNFKTCFRPNRFWTH